MVKFVKSGSPVVIDTPTLAKDTVDRDRIAPADTNELLNPRPMRVKVPSLLPASGAEPGIDTSSIPIILCGERSLGQVSALRMVVN